MSTSKPVQRGFTKLFNTIVTSTIWREDDGTRLVWITMLAIADSSGIVSASIPGLAAVANVDLDATKNALQNLLAPDEYSRTTDFDGRRIEIVEGGWRILNYQKYRRMLNEEERKEYKARWIKEKRQQASTEMLTNVDNVDECRRSPSASSSISLSDEAWIKELEQDTSYKDLDVQKEYGKMKRWCSVNNRKPTRRTFVNWLNRAEKPMKEDKKVPYRPVHPDLPEPPTPQEFNKAQEAMRKEVGKLKEQWRMK